MVLPNLSFLLYICFMKKRLLIPGFVLMIIAMLVMPNYPALHYYIEINHATFFNADPSESSGGSIVSDLNYLNALVQRTADIIPVKVPSPPKPQKEVNSYVYLVIDISSHLEMTSMPFFYKPYSTVWHGRFVPAGIPPPKA